MCRAIVYAINDLSRYFRHLFTCFLHCLISTKLGRTNNVQLLKRLFIASISRILRRFRRRSQLFILLTPTDVNTNVTCQTSEVCLGRRHIFITVFFGEGGVRRVAALFTFNPRAILNATRGNCFPNFGDLLMDLFVRRTGRRRLTNIIILCSNQGRSIRFVGVWVRNSCLLCF